MHSEEKKIFKKELQKTIYSVKKDLKDLKERMKPFVSEKAFGRTGTSDAMLKKSFQEGRVEALERKLCELEQNLDNIDSPEFGLCECCGGAIGEERHKALPEASKCIKCAE